MIFIYVYIMLKRNKNLLYIFLFLIAFSNIVKGQNDSIVNYKVDSIINLSNKIFYTKPDSASVYLQDAFIIAKKYNLKTQKARILINFGILFNEAGNLNDAEIKFKEALVIAQEVKDTTYIIRSLGNLGNTYMINGKYEKALDNFSKTVNLYRKTNNERGLAVAYGAMGNLYNYMKEYEKSIKYYKLAEQIFKKQNNLANIALINLNLGVIYLQQEEYSLSKEKLLSSLKYFEENKMFLNEGKCQSSLSKLFARQKNSLKSAEYAKKALSNYKKTNANYDMASLIYNVALNDYLNKDYKKAILGLDTAFNILGKTNNFKQLEAFSFIMKNCYDSIGNYNKAYYYANKNKQYSDSVININSANKFAEYEVKFETKEKQHKIEILTKNEEILLSKQKNNKLILLTLIIVIALSILLFALIYNRQKLKSEKLALEIEQKLLRLQMNPHFIFNSLYAIQNFLTNNDTVKTNKYLIKFARLLRKILESSTQNFITIEDEIEIIDNYISFQQLLNNNSFNYNINCSDDIEKDNVLIPRSRTIASCGYFI